MPPKTLKENLSDYRKLTENTIQNAFLEGIPEQENTAYNLERSGAQLVWCWLMVKENLSPAAVFRGEASPEACRRAGEDILAHYRQDPEAKPEQWFIGLMKQGAAKTAAFLREDGRLQSLDTSSPFLAVTDRELLPALKTLRALETESRTDALSSHWSENHEPAAGGTEVRLFQQFCNSAYGLPAYLADKAEALDRAQAAAFPEPGQYQPGKLDILLTRYAEGVMLAGQIADAREKGEDVSRMNWVDIYNRRETATSLALRLLKTPVVPENTLSPASLLEDEALLRQFGDGIAPAIQETNAWLTEKMKFVAAAAADGSLYRLGETADHTLSVQADRAFPDMEYFLIAVGKGRRASLSEVEFFDRDGNAASLSEALLNGGGQLIARKKGETELHAFAARDGAMAELFPGRDYHAANRAEKDGLKAAQERARAAINKVSANRIAGNELTDEQRVHEITEELKLRLAELKQADPWYVRSSRKFKDMMTGMEEVIRMGEDGLYPGFDLHSFQSALQSLRGQVKVYCEAKADEKAADGLSAIAEKRLGAAQHLNDMLWSTDEAVRSYFGGEARRELEDSLRKNLNYPMDNTLRSEYVCSFLERANAVRDRYIRRQNGENIPVSEREADDMNLYARVLYEASRGEADTLNRIELSGMGSAERQLLREGMTLTRLQRMPDPRGAGEAYTGAHFSEQIQKLGYRQELDRQFAAHRIPENQYRTETGMLTQQEAVWLTRLREKNLLTGAEVDSFRESRRRLADALENHREALEALRRDAMQRGGHVTNEQRAAAQAQYNEAAAAIRADETYQKIARLAVKEQQELAERARQAEKNAPAAEKNGPQPKKQKGGPSIG